MSTNKAKRKTTVKPKYKGIEFDSNDEIYTYMFLELCKKNKFISSFEFHPEPIEVIPEVSKMVKVTKQLKTKTVIQNKKEVLLRNLSYTPDFIIDDIYLDKLRSMFIRSKIGYVIDVKPKVNMRFNDNKYFSILQKTIYHTKGIFINKFICIDLFSDLFAPIDFIYTKTGKIRKHCEDMVTIDEFLKGDITCS